MKGCVLTVLTDTPREDILGLSVWCAQASLRLLVK